jgi:DUF1680 family protein
MIIKSNQNFECCNVAGLPEGTVGIKGKAIVETMTDPDELYTSQELNREEIEFIAIPYALWDNRGKANMAVWLRSE